MLEGVCVPVPGVEGGVNAGEIRPGSSPSLSGSVSGSESRCGVEDWSWLWLWTAREGFVKDRELRSSSDMARETGMGRGE